MNNFIEQHNIVLKDYSFVEAGIKKHKEELEELLNKLKETAELKRKEYIDLIVKDQFLDLLSNCVLFEGLSNEELDIVKKDFDSLKKSISAENLETVFNKINSVFPGLADLKNKPENPYGDYIIYHEMMKYMLNNKTSLVFLTFDNSKGDWMSKSKSPHLHYVQNMYSNTSNILYILDAERTLEGLLNVNIDSLVNLENSTLLSINLENLQQLALRHPLFKNIKPSPFQQSFIEELIMNGYTNINELE